MPAKNKNSPLLSSANENSLLKLAEPEILALDQERVNRLLSMSEPLPTGKIAARAGGENMLLSAPIKPLSLRGSDPLGLKARKKPSKEE